MEEVPRRTSLAPLASPCFVLCLIGMETNGRAFRLPGAGRGSFPLCGGTFARSYSVSTSVDNLARWPLQDEILMLHDSPLSHVGTMAVLNTWALKV